MKKGLCIFLSMTFCQPLFSQPELNLTSQTLPEIQPTPAVEPPLPAVSEIKPIPSIRHGIFNDLKVNFSYTQNGERISRILGPWDPAFEMLTETTGRYITLKEPIQFNKNMCIGLTIGFVVGVFTVGALMWFLQQFISKKKHDNQINL